MILIKITKENRFSETGDWTIFGKTPVVKGSIIPGPEINPLSLSVILDAPEDKFSWFWETLSSSPLSNSDEIFQWLHDNGKLGEEWVEWPYKFATHLESDKVELVLPNKINEKSLKEEKIILTKEQFISKVSKIDQTFEDEFKAEYNSPELIWEVIKKML